MGFKATKLYSVLFNKCPRCHEGDFFVTRNPYDLRLASHIFDHCPVCGLKYMREVGFFYGAMYVSYGLTVGLSFLFGLSDTISLAVLCVLALLLWTVIFRKARIIWINLFVKYDKNAADHPEHSEKN
jgi:hypothetical protein